MLKAEGLSDVECERKEKERKDEFSINLKGAANREAASAEKESGVQFGDILKYLLDIE